MVFKFIVCAGCIFAFGFCQQPLVIPPVITREPTQQPLFYETTAKVIFKITVPQRNVDSLLVTNLSPCRTSDYISGHYCPVQFHLQNGNSIIANKILFLNKNIPGSTYPTAFNPNDICHSISKDFTSQVSKENIVAEYFNIVNMCAGSVVVSTLQFPPDDINSIYAQSIQDYALSYMQSPMDRIQNASHTAANTALLSYGVLQHVIDKLVWNEAQEMCALSSFPVVLIPHLDLLNELQQLNILIRDRDYTTLFPFDIDNIGNYISLPLTDCTINGATNEMIVRLNIPIIKQRLNWKFFSFVYIPFRHEFNSVPYICARPTPNDLEGSLRNSFSYEKSSFSTYKSYFKLECEEFHGQKLCKVPNFDEVAGNRLWKPTCEQKILEDQVSNEHIIQYCPLECDPVSEFLLPIVVKASENEFYIAGEPTERLILRCNGEADIFLNLPPIGALHVKLRCGCTLTVDSIEYTTNRFSCTSDSFSNVVLPINLI